MKIFITFLISLFLATSAQAAPKKAAGDSVADTEVSTKADNGKGKEKDKKKKGKGENRKKPGKDDRAEPQDPSDALAALSNHPDDLLELKDVVGSGIGWDQNGTPIIKVYVAKGKGDKKIPKNIGQFSVKTENVGNVYALNVPCEERTSNGTNGGCKNLEQALDQNTDGLEEPASPQEWHERPAPIGISVGASAMAPGTLGCRVSRGCHNYALTNSHVVADDTKLIQPAAYDGGDTDDSIALLFEATKIVMNTFPETENRVDAAIYQVTTGMVDVSTRSNGYGAPMAITRDAELDLDVMKYGRSTAQTHGYIDAVGVTLIVNYADGESARFVDQMVIKSDDDSIDFSLPGDSGALVVADGGDDDRKPVGLVFASGKNITVANPIDAVLNELDIDIDGDFE